MSGSVKRGCCCSTPITCASCNALYNATHCSVRVVLSGVSTSCYQAWDTVPSSISGTWTVPIDGGLNVCSWTKSVGTPDWNLRQFPGVTCTGTPTLQNESSALNVKIQQISGVWKVTCTIIARLDPFTISNSIILFSGMADATLGCSGTYAISNNSQPGLPPTVGTGGTATVTLCV